MLRMSFLGHLEELRTRLLLTLGGIGVSFVLCLFFANQIWKWITRPIIEALESIGAEPNLVFTKPMDAFMMIWMKAPLLVALFLASPWVLYQVWGFIAPGLYKRERRWAAPFVLCTAGLFVLGGAFAYFVAFRFALEFLLGFGQDINVKPMITLTDYFDLFVNVTLGIGLVFELPVLLFFLTLLRVVTPTFLMRNVRYAILGITRDRRGRDSDSRYLQLDDVRGADVRAVLRRRLRQLPAGPAPGEAPLPMGEGALRSVCGAGGSRRAWFGWR